ncbi:MAG: FxsA family protein [Bdellovibrionaceae bacterium]|nr:FxsA family protein [Pseudobdellovibrionaceae bacterium]
MMFFLAPFPVFLFEFIAFVWLASSFGFFKVLLWYILPSFLGFVFLSLQSRAALLTLQKRLAEGRDPGFQLLNTAAKFLAGVFLVIPMLTTRVLGVILLVPGLRHVFLLSVHAWIARKITQGTFRVFRGGPMGGGGMGGTRFRTYTFTGGADPREAREERDATVIDVQPLEIEHTEKKDS